MCQIWAIISDKESKYDRDKHIKPDADTGTRHTYIINPYYIQSIIILAILFMKIFLFKELRNTESVATNAIWVFI